MGKAFRPWDVDQQWLLPPSVSEFVPEGHVAHFVRNLVREELDLSAILDSYGDGPGQPPHHPAMMTALLLYGYSRGVYSSRKLERASQERLDFMAITCLAKPDHSRINAFRQRHREALKGLFVQVLLLCKQAGLVKLGHVALDGTKMQANASKHAAMSYGRMTKAQAELATEVEQWLQEADAADTKEDTEFGPDKTGDELPDWVKNKQRRLEKIREAKARLEQEARDKANQLAAEREEKERERGKAVSGKRPKALDGVPEDKAQSNFTDPESRIMKTGSGFEQAYNCQAAVDAESQVITAQAVTAEPNDKGALEPLIDQVRDNTGNFPKQVSADAGYCSEKNLQAIEDRAIDGYVATGRQKHGTPCAAGDTSSPTKPLTQAMRSKLKQGGWASPYHLRKQTVEPVFGQIKEARGFRRFLTRGITGVALEWSLLCTVHNILKLAFAKTQHLSVTLR